MENRSPRIFLGYKESRKFEGDSLRKLGVKDVRENMRKVKIYQGSTSLALLEIKRSNKAFKRSWFWFFVLFRCLLSLLIKISLANSEQYYELIQA